MDKPNYRQGPKNAATMAATAGAVIKNGPGLLLRFSVYNAGAAMFIQLHDAASVPADTAVPVLSLAIPATGNLVVDFGVYGKKFQTGIVLCNSSTVATKTAAAAGLSFEATYE